MDPNLRAKTVLVTGASNGIGRGCAELFAAEGANLHLTARRGDLLLMSRRVALDGGALLRFALAAVFAPLFAPHEPVEQDRVLQYIPPFWDEKAEPGYLFGTDNLGRDILSRLRYGAQIALFVAVTAAAATGLHGTVLGLLAGFVDGWVDTDISRLVEIWMAFPAVLLSIVVVAVTGRACIRSSSPLP